MQLLSDVLTAEFRRRALRTDREDPIDHISRPAYF